MAKQMSWLEREIDLGRITRREFVSYCSFVAGLFALPASMGSRIAEAAENAERPIVMWMEFQDCAGNSESLLRGSRPTAAELILDHISLEYHETIMAAAGHQAEEHRQDVLKKHKGEFIAIVEGSIPAADGGVYCCVGGQSAMDLVEETCRAAAATIAVGTCATFGGLPAAAPNPTGALSVADAVPGLKNLINVPACPANVENLTALILYYLTFNRFPPLDRLQRPLFAYGKAIHDNCERRAHFDNGLYAEQWGDDAHRHGACLYKLGCKGPVTSQNCPVVRWNEGTNWPIGCGHPCIGCAEPDFWDKMTPFYAHLPTIPGAGVGTPLDTVGAVAVGATAAAFVAHGVIKAVRDRAVPDNDSTSN